MKNIISSLYFFLMFGLTTGYTQPYESIFGNSITSWSIQIEGIDHGDTDSLTTVFDTTFNNFNYKYVQNHYYIGISGFIREDTLQGKAWFYNPATSTEELIMDLSLSVGDTIFYTNSYYTAVVDSVYYINGKKHIQFNRFIFASNNFTSGYKPFTFIEGVGSNAGIIYPFYWGSNYLLCASKDFVATYVDSFFNGNCYVTWVGINENQKKTNWKLYPNPSSEYTILSIEDLPNEEFSLYIYDVYGRMVKEINNIVDKEIRINNTHLQSGIYFFNIQTKNNIIANGKMIVQ